MQDAYEALKLAAGDTASPIDVGSVNDQVCWAAASIYSIEMLLEHTLVACTPTLCMSHVCVQL